MPAMRPPARLTGAFADVSAVAADLGAVRDVAGHVAHRAGVGLELAA